MSAPSLSAPGVRPFPEVRDHTRFLQRSEFPLDTMTLGFQSEGAMGPMFCSANRPVTGCGLPGAPCCRGIVHHIDEVND